MPGLRILRLSVRSAGTPTAELELPTEGPVSDDIRVAIFDGGVSTNHALTQWVTPHEIHGMLPATDEYLSHGVGVTAAALFGHINTKATLPRPLGKYRPLSSPRLRTHELP